MDNAVKKAFVIFPLVVIALCAYFAASGTSNVVRVWLSDSLEAGQAKNDANAARKGNTNGQARKRPPALSYDPITGMPVRKELEDAGTDIPDASGGPAIDTSADPLTLANDIDCGASVLSGTPCEAAVEKYGFIIGTLVSTNPMESSVRLMTKDKSSKSYELNDMLGDSAGLDGSGGARVAKICRSKVYVTDGGKLSCITSEEDSKALANREVAPMPGGPVEDGVAKVSETEFKIARGEIDNALNNLDKLATQARIVPHFQGGKSVGFRLYAIKPGSLFSKIGLKNGDILQRINGMDINSPEKALEIYTKLRDAKNISLDMQRRGKPLSVEYNIQ